MTINLIQAVCICINFIIYHNYHMAQIINDGKYWQIGIERNLMNKY